MSGTNSKTTQSLPPWAQQYGGMLLGAGQNLVDPGSWTPPAGGNSVTPAAINPALFQQIAPFNPTQQAGMDYLTGGAGANAALAGAGASEIGNTLGGKYLDPASNPYLTATFNDASSGLVNQYQRAIAPGLAAQAQQAGVSGGSAEAQQGQQNQFDLGQNLANLATQIYGGNYATERGIQAQAPGQIGAAQAAMSQPGQQLLGVGTLQQGQTQAGLDAATANAQLANEYPYKTLSFLTNLLGSVTSGGSQVTAGTSK